MLAERAVGTVQVMVVDVFGEDGFKMPAPENEDPVQTLAPDGADDALADGVRPRRPAGGLDDPDVLCSEHRVEGSGLLHVLIEDE